MKLTACAFRSPPRLIARTGRMWSSPLDCSNAPYFFVVCVFFVARPRNPRRMKPSGQLKVNLSSTNLTGNLSSSTSCGGLEFLEMQYYQPNSHQSHDPLPEGKALGPARRSAALSPRPSGRLSFEEISKIRCQENILGNGARKTYARAHQKSTMDRPVMLCKPPSLPPAGRAHL